ncbi:MAG: VOC family protein, partial [Bacteroidota bacterium]
MRASYDYMVQQGAKIMGSLSTAPDGSLTFFVEDPSGNPFQIVEGSGWFTSTGHPSNCGGVAGSIIGVSSMEQSLKLYRDVLGYETVVYDVTGSFEDFSPLSQGTFRRVKLIHREARKGPFAKLLGPTSIELVQAMDRTDVRRIFENRFWGDWGFIHLCFDIQGMDALKNKCEQAGFPFTVDSANTFDMGEAGGRFSYIEDPDGAWIEFVETHKVPLIKKIGWYLNLKNRQPGKFLPNWMLKAMAFN